MFRHLALSSSCSSIKACPKSSPLRSFSSSRRILLAAHERVQSNIRVYDGRRKRQRLFLAGVNPFLPPSVKGAISPSFVEVPLSYWLQSLGVQADDDGQVEITKIASGYAHAMIAYRLGGAESIFAIGRNASGQLGIGYNSQVWELHCFVRRCCLTLRITQGTY